MFVIPFACALLLGASTFALNHGAAVNPTGDPIGGGPGYSRILNRTTATFIVSDRPGLLAALSSAAHGDVVYIEDSAVIDLNATGSRVVIPAGVTLASGRGRGLSGGNHSLGALIRCQKTSVAADTNLFEASGSVRITGLRFLGPDTEVGDHGYSQNSTWAEAGIQGHVVGGILTNAANVEVDNCDMRGFSNAALYFSSSAPNGKAHHNWLGFNRRIGLGYGIEVGSTANLTSVLIEANVFEANRHGIASSGFPHSSYEARFNYVHKRTVDSSFDRHGTANPGSWFGGDAGIYTIVHHNTVMQKDHWAVGLRGVPVVKNGLQVYNNWFADSDSDTAIWWYEPGDNETRLIQDNILGTLPPCGTPDTVLIVSVSPSRGIAPLEVSFDSSQSYSNCGSLCCFEWDFGDGQVSYGSKVSHNFTDAGRYLVELRARDELGIPAAKFIPIVVYPTAGPYVLSAWVKDSYRGIRSGYYNKSIFVADTLVWTDDIAGDEGWQHILVDVTTAVGNKTDVSVKLVAISSKAVTSPMSEIIEAALAWDDVILFGTPNDVAEDFEEGTASSLVLTTTASSSWRGDTDCGETRSGTYAFLIAYPYNTASVANSNGTATLTFSLAQKTTFGLWSMNEESGNSTSDSSPWHQHCTVYSAELMNGVIGNAFLFNGGQLQCSLSAPSTSIGSIQFWTRPGQMQAQEFFLITGSTAELSVSMSYAGDIIVCIVNTSGSVLLNVSTPTLSVSTQTNTLITVIQNGASLAIFVNRNETAVTGRNGVAWIAAVSPKKIVIGGSGARQFAGMIDELFITSKVLSAADVSQAVSSATTLMSLPLNEGSGNISLDQSESKLRLSLWKGVMWTGGVNGSALSFNGSVTATASDSKGVLAPAGDFTVEAWIRFDDFSQNQYPIRNSVWQLFYRGDWASNILYFLVNLKKVNGSAVAKQGDSAWTGQAGVKSVTLLSIGKWNHIAVARTGSFLLMFVNGKLERKSYCLNGVAIDSTTWGALTLGKGFHGAVDEIVVYNRALTSVEVAKRYAQFHTQNSTSCVDDGSDEAETLSKSHKYSAASPISQSRYGSSLPSGSLESSILAEPRESGSALKERVGSGEALLCGHVLFALLFLALQQ